MSFLKLKPTKLENTFISGQKEEKKKAGWAGAIEEAGRQYAAGLKNAVNKGMDAYWSHQMHESRKSTCYDSAKCDAHGIRTDKYVDDSSRDAHRTPYKVDVVSDAHSTSITVDCMGSQTPPQRQHDTKQLQDAGWDYQRNTEK